MRLKIFAIRDTATDAFAQPFFLHTDAEAARAVAMASRDPASNLYQTPEDFTLFCVGVWDSDTGQITADGVRRIGGIRELRMPFVKEDSDA